MFYLINFCTLCVVWVFISGKLDMFHLSLGVVSCFIVALTTTDLLYKNRDKGVIVRIREAGRFISYIWWLLSQIVLANMNVIGIALSLKPVEETIDPHIFTFKTHLKTDFAKFVLANSITLTPGTVTIRIQGDIFYIHAITYEAAGDLDDDEQMSEMEKRVAWVFEGGHR